MTRAHLAAIRMILSRTKSLSRRSTDQVSKLTSNCFHLDHHRAARLYMYTRRKKQNGSRFGGSYAISQKSQVSYAIRHIVYKAPDGLAPARLSFSLHCLASFEKKSTRTRLATALNYIEMGPPLACDLRTGTPTNDSSTEKPHHVNHEDALHANLLARLDADGQAWQPREHRPAFHTHTSAYPGG
jgi:hypothetical protein